MPIRLQQTALPQFGGSGASAGVSGVLGSGAAGILSASAAGSESGLNTVDGLLSRAINATVTSGNASDLNDGSYSTDWLSGAPPVTVTWPIGEVKASQRQKLFFSWEATHQYNWQPATTYEGIAAYTLEANTAANGTAPTTGWVTLATVSGNVLKGRGHLLENMGQYNWLRMVVTAAYSGSGTNAVSANFALADESERLNEEIPGIFFVGDSNTANGMSVKQATVGHKNVGDLIRDALGYYVPTVNAGVSGSATENWASGDLYNKLEQQLSEWPGRYVIYNLGTNVSTSATAWRNETITVGQLVARMGKKFIVAHPIWSQTPSVASAVASYIAEIPAVLAAVPGAIDGPDFYTATLNQNGMFADALHLNEAAYQTAMREVCATFMATVIGNEYVPAVGARSTAYDLSIGGVNNEFYVLKQGHPGRRRIITRPNMWGFYTGGYSTDWTFQANDYRDFRCRGAFTNGFGEVKGYPCSSLGWSKGENQTNAKAARLGIKLSELDKCVLHQTLYVDAFTPVSTSHRAVMLADTYWSDIANPDTSITNIPVNILFHQYICDPQEFAFYSTNFHNGWTVTTKRGFQYRVDYDLASELAFPFSTRIMIYVAVMDGWTFTPYTYEWGALSKSVDMLDLFEALRDDATLGPHLTDYDDLYLATLNAGCEPLALDSAKWFGWSNTYFQVNDDPDFGEAAPVGGMLSECVPIIAFDSAGAVDGHGGDGNDAQRSLLFRSTGVPVSMVARMGTVRPANKSRLLFLYEASNCIDHDHALNSLPGYNNAGSYVLETHTKDYGNTPTSGWTNRLTVTGNTRKYRAHVLSMTGSEVGMLRFRVTAADGDGGGNMDFGGRVQIYTCKPTGRPHGAIIIGDQLVSYGLSWYNSTGRTTALLCEQVYDQCGTYMPTASAGWSGKSAADFATTNLAAYQAWLDEWPCSHAVICLGTNDANNASAYLANLTTLAQQAMNRGIVPIICTPPWASAGTHSHMATLAAQVPAAVSAVSGALSGADLYAATLNQTTWLETDGITFKEIGWAAIETAIATNIAGHFNADRIT